MAWSWSGGAAAATMAAALVAALVAAAGTASASPAEGIQPLSKIAVHKATVEIQPSAYVEATPASCSASRHVPRTPTLRTLRRPAD